MVLFTKLTSVLARHPRGAASAAAAAANTASLQLCKPSSKAIILAGNVDRAVVSCFRAFSSSGGDGTGKDSDEDPFGVNFQDSTGRKGSGNIGPKESLPPNYGRDSTTGKFTGEILDEASAVDKKLLNLGAIAKERILTARLEASISNENTMKKDSGLSHSMSNVARHIREDKMSLNTIGRKVADVSEALEDNMNMDETGAAASLSQNELESLHNFMEKTTLEGDVITQHLMDESKDLLPTIARKSSSKSASTSASSSHDNPDLDLEWMTMKAQSSMTGIDAEDLEDPFANLMPSDLNPAKKVNRRNAKLIPKKLLHHNNLTLLRRYVSPGGQIMNRVQSRLGAKDQRKVAKMVKRARNLGLIPVIGQWKVEDRGNLMDPSLLEDTEWEKKLLERGLVERKSSSWEKKKEEQNPMSNIW